MLHPTSALCVSFSTRTPSEAGSKGQRQEREFGRCSRYCRERHAVDCALGCLVEGVLLAHSSREGKPGEDKPLGKLHLDNQIQYRPKRMILFGLQGSQAEGVETGLFLSWTRFQFVDGSDRMGELRQPVVKLFRCDRLSGCKFGPTRKVSVS
jgi:hypothetical protein